VSFGHSGASSGITIFDDPGVAMHDHAILLPGTIMQSPPVDNSQYQTILLWVGYPK